MVALPKSNLNSDKAYFQSYETKVFKKNEIIYLKGQKINFVYIILNGQVKSVLDNSKSLKENITLKNGSSLGLMDLILNREYSKTMLAKSTSVLAIIKPNYFLDLLKAGNCETILLKSLAIDIDVNYPNIWS